MEVALTNQITDEMQEALARVVGLHQDFPDVPNPHWYSRPDEDGVSTLLGKAGELPDLTRFDNLFELVVQEIWNRKMWIQLLGDGLLGWDCRICPLASNSPVSIYQHKDLGHALFLACCKVLGVIDGTQDTE